MGFDFGKSVSNQNGGAKHSPSKPPNASRGYGFADKPTFSSGSSYQPIVSPNDGLQAPRRQRVPRTSRIPRDSFAMRDIPWEIVFGVMTGLAIIAFLWINREAISAFFSEVFFWVFVILICYFFLRIVFCGRFTRR